jgi:hypothetical protein
MARLGRGDFFGEVSTLFGVPSLSSLRATSRCRLAQFGATRRLGSARESLQWQVVSQFEFHGIGPRGPLGIGLFRECTKCYGKREADCNNNADNHWKPMSHSILHVCAKHNKVAMENPCQLLSFSN